jgi:hypothetical protein
MKTNREETRRFPIVRHIKISRELNDEIVRRAREDERPIGSFVRRILSRALRDDGHEHGNR